MISKAGYDLIRQFEGLVLKAYPDPASGGDPWTIGYGHTKDVQKGDVITEEQAEQYLYEDAMEAWTGVLGCVTVQLEQWELDALTSFVFNLGIGNLKSSTLLRKLNAGDRKGAADEFLRWNKAAGKVMAGLTRRRSAERTLFLNQGAKPVLPFIAAVLPSLISAAPDLIRAFGGEGKITERNAKAAEIVVNAAKVATGSVNEQELMEKIESKDPVVMEQIQQAVKEVWFEISSDNSGIQAAREANTKSEGFWKQPAFWITLILVPLVYIVVLTVLGLLGATVFSTEIQIMVVSSIISGLLGAITGFWLGTSWSSARKTELAGK